MSKRWAEANQRFNATCLQRVSAFLACGPCAPVEAIADELRACEMAMDRPPAITALRDAFGLSYFEQDLLMLCAGVALDDGVRRALTDGRGEDPRHGAPTFGLALAALPGAHWTALTPGSPLRRWSLIECGPGQLITECPLYINERVLHYLAGVHYVDESLGIRSIEVVPELPGGQAGVARDATACIANADLVTSLSSRCPPDVARPVVESRPLLPTLSD